MIIAGIDPGLAATGYGLIKQTGNQITPLTWGVIRSGDGNLVDRLQIIHDKIREIFAEYHPELVGIEDIFTGRNPRSALLLGHARGALLIASNAPDRVITEYPARSVKQAVVGNGAASKTQVRFMVMKLLGVSDQKIAFDASDALAVAICCSLKSSSIINIGRQ